MQIDLNRLAVFHEVYSAASIVKAAEQLHITQPAVSQQIKKLEQELNIPLFTRLHKRIIPTAAAHRLHNLVKPFLDRLNDEMEYVSVPMERPYGSLRIGAPIIFGTTYLTEICHAFRALYPEVSFVIKFEESDVLVEMLNNGRLDLALIDFFSPYDQLPGKPEIYRIEALMEESLILACSKDYYKARVGGDISFNHLMEQDFITDENEPIILKHWFWYYFKRKATGFNIVMAIEAHQALMACIRNGMGMAVTSYHLFEDEIKRNEIIPVFPEPKNLINTISMVTLETAVPTVTQKVFQNFLMARFDDKPKGGPPQLV